MTLTNYWWLLIWMFTGGLLIAMMSTYRQSMAGIRYEKARSGLTVLSALLTVLPFIIWGGFRTDYFGDTGAYRSTFNAIPVGFGELSAYMETITKDKGFYFLGAVWKNVVGSSDVVYFLAFALLQMGVLAWLYRKYSPDYVQRHATVHRSGDRPVGYAVYPEKTLYSRDFADPAGIDHAPVGAHDDPVSVCGPGKSLE